ncbi:ferric uptake regulator CjrA [Salmonella enterica subsp. enterica serovar Choleraesuis]|nr:ferric uptake regulator CjrA [Salmonella enterica subsp. enterica serovar Choleraesuis]
MASRAPGVSDNATNDIIIDLHSGQKLTRQQLLTRLTAAPRLIVGEKHDNKRHHEIESWLLVSLAQQRPQGSVLLEMLTAGQQPAVQGVKAALKTSSELSEAEIQQRLSWQKGWPWSMYGDVVMPALSAPYPLLAANINRDRVMALYKKPTFPKGRLSTAPEVQQAISAIIVDMHGGKIPSAQLQGMLAIQQQRDRYMAEQLLAAPTPALLIAGGYHASKQIGVPLHIKDLQPDTSLMVLMLAEDGSAITAEQADYVWYVTPQAAIQAGK